MNVYYEKVISCKFRGLESWASHLEVHVFVLRHFCIENYRKIGKIVIFQDICKNRHVNAVETPSHGLFMLWWTSSDTFLCFLISSRIFIRSVRAIFRPNWVVFGHILRFQMKIEIIEQSNHIFHILNDFQ